MRLAGADLDLRQAAGQLRLHLQYRQIGGDNVIDVHEVAQLIPGSQRDLLAGHQRLEQLGDEFLVAVTGAVDVFEPRVDHFRAAGGLRCKHRPAHELALRLGITSHARVVECRLGEKRVCGDEQRSAIGRGQLQRA